MPTLTITTIGVLLDKDEGVVKAYFTAAGGPFKPSVGLSGVYANSLTS